MTTKCNASWSLWAPTLCKNHTNVDQHFVWFRSRGHMGGSWAPHGWTSSIFDRFWSHLKLILGPKGIQNRSKIDLGGPLGSKWAKASIFDRFLIHFWSTLGSLWEHFLVKNSSKEGIVFWHQFLSIFGSILGTPNRAKVSIPFDTVINFKKITISKNIHQKAPKEVPF